jgi:hypothetical protein
MLYSFTDLFADSWAEHEWLAPRSAGINLKYRTATSAYLCVRPVITSSIHFFFRQRKVKSQAKWVPFRYRKWFLYKVRRMGSVFGNKVADCKSQVVINFILEVIENSALSTNNIRKLLIWSAIPTQPTAGNQKNTNYKIKATIEMPEGQETRPNNVPPTQTLKNYESGPQRWFSRPALA